MSSLDSRQRLALYEHAIEKTRMLRGPELSLSELDLAFSIPATSSQTGEPLSRLEMLAAQRDAKRRRLNYRQAKKVHTSHKSHTEITREVIENQMSLYQEWLQEGTEHPGELSSLHNTPTPPATQRQEHKSVERPDNSYRSQSDARDKREHSRGSERPRSDHHRRSRDDRDESRQRYKGKSHDKNRSSEHARTSSGHGHSYWSEHERYQKSTRKDKYSSHDDKYHDHAKKRKYE